MGKGCRHSPKPRPWECLSSSRSFSGSSCSKHGSPTHPSSGSSPAAAKSSSKSRWHARSKSEQEEIRKQTESILKKAKVQISTRPDGHISLVDLEGVSTGLIRENDIVEVLRQLVRRSVSPLGMQTPKGGHDPGRKWRHKGPNAFFEVMSKFGSSGGMRYEYEMAGMDGDVARINAEGKATVASNTQREQGLPASLSLLGSSLAFAAFHLEACVAWLGVGGDPFEPAIFTYRVLAGMLLGLLFRWRGPGVAAWAHGLFNLGLLLGAGPDVFR